MQDSAPRVGGKVLLVPSGPRRSRRTAIRFAVPFALVLVASLVVLGREHASAAVLGITKSVVNVPPGGVQPEGTFIYRIVVGCTSLDQECTDVTVTDTLPSAFVPGLVAGTFSVSGGASTPPGGTIFPGIATYTYSYDAAGGAFSLTLPTLAAGATVSIDIGVTLPVDTPLPDGTVVPNQACVVGTNADNAPPGTPLCDSVDVVIDIPVALDITASKDWSDGSALAQSDEVSTITLGIANRSSSSTDVTQLALTDQTTGTPATDPWNYFTLTGLGTVTYPAGADQVQVRYCLEPYATPCGSWTDGAVQTGATLVPDPNLDLAGVTGLQLIFSSSTGAVLPFDANGGSVAFQMTLRDTARIDGATIEPTSTLILTNTAIPSSESAAGSVDEPGVSDDFQIVPNLAKVSLSKDWFADADGDLQPDVPPSAFAQQNWPVSMVINAVNQSPFPVETVTITEPSVSANSDGPDPDTADDLEYLDLQEVIVTFPPGAATADVVVTCADGTVQGFALTQPPSPQTLSVGTDIGCAKITRVEVTFTGVGGGATIQPNETGGLALIGTLDQNAVSPSSPLANCADGTAINTGNGSTSAVATACDPDGLVIESSGVGPTGGTKSLSQDRAAAGHADRLHPHVSQQLQPDPHRRAHPRPGVRRSDDRAVLDRPHQLDHRRLRRAVERHRAADVLHRRRRRAGLHPLRRRDDRDSSRPRSAGGSRCSNPCRSAPRARSSWRSSGATALRTAPACQTASSSARAAASSRPSAPHRAVVARLLPPTLRPPCRSSSSRPPCLARHPASPRP